MEDLARNKIKNLVSVYVSDEGIIIKNRFGETGMGVWELSRREYEDLFYKPTVAVETSEGIQVFYKGNKVTLKEIIDNKWI